MSGLVEQLQREALDPQVSVSTLLRKVKLAATKLRLGQVADWVTGELSGYDGDVPNYRVLRGQPKAFNPYRGWIPIHGSANFVETISRFPLGQSLPEIESLITRESGQLFFPYPPAIVNRLNQDMGVSFPQMGAFIDRSVLVGVLESVRNEVLDWAMELEAAGITGEGISFSTDEQRKASTVSVHIGNFSGNLNTGDASGTGARISQEARDISQTIKNAKFSFEELVEAIERGVAQKQEREALLAVVQEMRESAGTSRFTEAYRAFVSSAADHMAILSPFIPGLTALLG